MEGAQLRELPARPLVKPWYRVAQTADGLALEYAQRVVTFAGRSASSLLPALLPLLDGTRTVDELVDCGGEGSRTSLLAVLGLLARHGLLTEGPPPASSLPRAAAESASFVAAAFGGGRTAAAALDALVSFKFAVAGAGRVASEAARLLADSGAHAVDRISLRQSAERAVGLTIVAPAAAEQAGLPEWNAAALAGERPWLLVLPFDGRYAAVGPLFVPGHTACYECFRRRRLAGLDYDSEFWALERATPPPRSVASLDAAAAGLAVTVALVYAGGSSLGVVGGFHALDAGLGVGFHRLLRVPRCPACSGVADTAPPLPWFKEEGLDAAA